MSVVSGLLTPRILLQNSGKSRVPPPLFPRGLSSVKRIDAPGRARGSGLTRTISDHLTATHVTFSRREPRGGEDRLKVLVRTVTHSGAVAAARPTFLVSPRRL